MAATDLKPEARLVNTATADLAQVASVDVAPGVALSRFGLVHVSWEVSLILVRLDDVPDSQRVDVDAVSAGERASGLFATDLGQGVRVHGVDVVVFFEREGVVVVVSLGKADAIGSLGTRDDDLLDSQFAGCFDDLRRVSGEYGRGKY